MASVRKLVLIAICVCVLGITGTAGASPYVRYGIQDDAWLAYGPGTIDARAATLKGLGVEVVRYTLRWDQVETARGRYDWGASDTVLNALDRAGLAPVVTIWGTPRFANGDRSPNWAPGSATEIARFARAAATHYRFVRYWTIWNEPNQRRWLRPTSASTYTTKLLNPAYTSLHAVTRGALVGGGVTAPRGSAGGISPVDFIHGMRAAHARLDAYAHHPYPLRPTQTPWSGGCGHCETITMATLGRLRFEVRRAFGNTRIWLTEYGYQTNPPDRTIGVSYATQTRYLGDAARRVFAAPRVDMLIHYLYRDEPEVGRWQSGLMSAGGSAKPARAGYRLPLSQVSRQGLRTVVWGQMRPGFGAQRYVLQQFRDGSWHSAGGVRKTTARGFFSRTLRAGKGSRVRVWSPSDRTVSPPLPIR